MAACKALLQCNAAPAPALDSKSGKSKAPTAARLCVFQRCSTRSRREANTLPDDVSTTTAKHPSVACAVAAATSMSPRGAATAATAGAPGLEVSRISTPLATATISHGARRSAHCRLTIASPMGMASTLEVETARSRSPWLASQSSASNTPARTSARDNSLPAQASTAKTAHAAATNPSKPGCAHTAKRVAAKPRGTQTSADASDASPGRAMAPRAGTRHTQAASCSAATKMPAAEQQSSGAEHGAA